MSKKLNDMTLAELWQLFPIILSPPDARFKRYYEEERALLLPALPKDVKLYHIGSTAIGTIYAKPTVDLLAETEDFSLADAGIQTLGYSCMRATDTRRDYQKGYTDNGFAERVFHLHLRAPGDHDELYFRDYLIAHPEIAKRYEALKLSLWKRFEHDRDGYTDAKSAFVCEYTRLAKAQFAGRYE